MGVETGGDGGDASPPVEESGGDVPSKKSAIKDFKSDYLQRSFHMKSFKQK